MSSKPVNKTIARLHWRRVYLKLYALIRKHLYADSAGTIGTIISVPLLLLGYTYFFCVGFRRMLYRSSMLKKKRVNSKVIGIGNITMGGSGKTTITMELAEYIHSKGRSVAILSRGYKGTENRRIPFAASRGNGPLREVHQIGDEPYMMADRLRDGVAVIVGKNRVKAARLAIREFGSHFLLLDDAFQFLPLHKDFEIVLINESDLLGNRRPLPAGPFREPLSSVIDADIVIIIKGLNSNRLTEFDGLNDFPAERIFEVRPNRILFKSIFYDSGEARPEMLVNRRILSFTSIARSDTFKEIISTLKPEWFELIEYPDHFYYGIDELLAIKELANEKQAIIITTEKDRVKVDWEFFEGIECFTVLVRYDIFKCETKVRNIIDAFIDGGHTGGV